MAKFRTKPISIKAEKWFPGKDINCVKFDKDFGDIPYIETREGNMFVSPGDWIITEVNGEKYPCKPDVFERFYEAVKD